MTYPRVKLPLTEAAYYHVTDRTVQQRFLIEDVDKKVLREILAFLVKTYFVNVLAFQFLDNHYHIILRIMRPEKIAPEEIEQRFYNYYKEKKKLISVDQEKLLNGWADISKFMKDLNQRFARHMNWKNNTRRAFLAATFHNTILEGESALLKCMVYVDLNVIRAGIVDSPKDYEFGTIGYMLQTQNKLGILNLSFLEKVLRSCMELSEVVVKKISSTFQQIPKCIREIYSLYIQYIQEMIDEEKSSDLEAVSKIIDSEKKIQCIQCQSKIFFSHSIVYKINSYRNYSVFRKDF